MEKRNKDLERKALSMMLEHEERELKRRIGGRGRPGRGKRRQAKVEENSFSDGDDDSEGDEAIQMAIKLSEQEAQADQKRHQSRFGEKNAQY